MSENVSHTWLAKIAHITVGQSPGSGRYNKEERGLPFLQGCAEFGRRHPEPEIYCNPPLRIAKQNSILISVRAPVGTMNKADQDYCIGRGLGAIHGILGVTDTSFLRYAIEQNVGFLHRRSQGSTFLAIGSGDLRRLPLPKLDIKVQESISAVLEAADGAIEKTESLIAKYQQIKVGLMHDLFTHGVTSNGKLRPPREKAPELYKETPIGWVPKVWETTGLRAKAAPGIAHLRTGPFGSSLKGEHWVEEGYPVVTIGALGEGTFIESGLLYISNFDARRLSEFQLKLGDVVFSRVADVGRSVAIRSEHVGWIMSSNLMRISLDRKQVLPDLLQQQLSFDHRLKQQIRVKVNSSGRDVANSEILNQLLFVWPTYDEQQRIVRQSAAIDRRLQSEESQREKLIKQKYGLMHDLLTGKVLVKVERQPMEMACG